MKFSSLSGVLVFVLLLGACSSVANSETETTGPKIETTVAQDTTKTTTKAQGTSSTTLVTNYDQEEKELEDYNIKVFSILIEPLIHEEGRWIEQFKIAVEDLPSETRNTIVAGGSENYLRLVFAQQMKEWHTGTASRTKDTITINLTPNPNHPFPFEYFSENGYTEEEMLIVALHELGHMWDFNTSPELSSDIYNLFNQAVTRYGCYNYIESCTDMGINVTENFAEVFALYFVMPDYVKSNFLEEYVWLRDNVFYGKEYNITYSIPSSVEAKLTVSFPEK